MCVFKIGFEHSPFSEYGVTLTFQSERELALALALDGAFSGCANLTNVTIEKSVPSIPARMFYGCTSLTSVIIPGSVTVIGSSAFYGCTNLNEVIVGSGVASLGVNAFGACGTISLYFRGDAPTVSGTTYNSENSFTRSNAMVYYIKGKSGWTTPMWYGCATALWDDVNLPHDHNYAATVTAPTAATRRTPARSAATAIPMWTRRHTPTRTENAPSAVRLTRRIRR